MLDFVTWWPFVTVGAVVLGRWLWDAWAVLYTLLSTRFLPKTLAERYGHNSYVLITGSTDGLGKAFALEVARRGLNLVLVSRTQTKLEATRKEILAVNPKIKVEIFALDFSGLFRPNKVAELAKFTQNLDVSVVINNVGMTYENGWRDQLFANKDTGTLVNILSTNMLSQALMHLHFGKRLAARPGRSGFLDVSSCIVNCYHPSSDIYAASKAFNMYLSVSITNEGVFPSVDCLNYRPGMMRTNMIKSAGVSEEMTQSFMTKPPADCAAEALDALGLVAATNGNLAFFMGESMQEVLNYAEWTPLFRVLWDKTMKTAMGME